MPTFTITMTTTVKCKLTSEVLVARVDLSLLLGADLFATSGGFNFWFNSGSLLLEAKDDTLLAEALDLFLR